MSRLTNWLIEHALPAQVPLFLEQNLLVETFPRSTRTLLQRHPDFDARMIDLVEQGLPHSNWQGLVYVMHWLREGNIHPLYIGKAERRGRTHDLSQNLANIRRNLDKFGRWGYGLDYHIGDLSHVLFGGKAYRGPTRKYERWAEALFVSRVPPCLQERVYVSLIGWESGMCGPSGLVGSVPAVEKELIALAAAEFPAMLLNRDGR